MPVMSIYDFASISPGTTASVWVHGFSWEMVPVFVAIPNLFHGPIGGGDPLPQFNLSQGEFSIHEDGSIARFAAVEQLPISGSSGGALLLVLYDYAS